MASAAAFNILVEVWVAGEIGLLIFTHTRKHSGSLRDRGSLLLLWPAIWLSITAGGWFAATHPASPAFTGRWLMPAALTLLVGGLLMRWTAILSLGRAFSVNVAIRTGQQVKQDGLYRLVRHPSYSALLLMLLSVGLSMHNWIALAITLIPPILALLYRIRVEERALAEAFGSEYVTYCNATKRLIPAVY